MAGIPSTDLDQTKQYKRKRKNRASNNLIQKKNSLLNFSYGEDKNGIENQYNEQNMHEK